MTNFIPIFPLQIVVFPGEALNLHIFEPRYKQLVEECLAEGKPFGIPSVSEQGQEQELGTLMDIEKLETRHEDGTLDIRTRGRSVFRVLQRIDSVPDKEYAGAIVTYPDNVLETEDSRINKTIIAEVKRLYALLNVAEKFPGEERMIRSYDIGHIVGLSKAQEYELLGLFTEIHRLEFIRRHLNQIVPVINELEQMKSRIQMNGHFRNLSL
jgi:Lon protease-like protein